MPRRGCTSLLFIALILTTLSTRPAHAQQPLWQQTNGPSSGEVTQLVHGGNGLLFALASGYVYRSAGDGHA